MRNNNANITILVLLLAGNMFCYAQTNDSLLSKQRLYYLVERNIKTEILFGFNWQGNWGNDENSATKRYLELGFARSLHNNGRHGPASMGIYISEVAHFGRTNIYGTKLGVYAHYLFDVGFSMLYYTDFKKANFKLCPELGAGIGGFRIVAGYNIPTIDNKAFEALRSNTAQLTIQAFLPVKKKIISGII